MFASADPRRFAAVVYDDRVSIDALLGAFAADLMRSGLHLAGVIQVPHEDGCGPRALSRVRDVATGELLPICRTVGGSCRPDRARFERAASPIREGFRTGADLIVVSRFGRLEADGRGFGGEVRQSIATGQPLITAVRRGHVHRWFDFTGGVGTVLDAHLWVLHHWWREITPLGVQRCA